LTGKTINLSYSKLEKVCITYLSFQSRWPRDGHIYGIVHDNVPLFGIEVHLGMEKISPKEDSY
jgi:hypothetical protein